MAQGPLKKLPRPEVARGCLCLAEAQVVGLLGQPPSLLMRPSCSAVVPLVCEGVVLKLASLPVAVAPSACSSVVEQAAK